MSEKIAQRLQAFADRAAAWELQQLLESVFGRFKSTTLSSAGLVIKAGASPLAKTGAAVTHYMANGVKGRVPAGTDMPALVGTVNNAKFNVFVFSVTAAGLVSVQMGVEGSTEAQIRWPKSDPKKAILGMIIVNPAGTGNFVGGTTALDDATVIGAGSVTYISPVGAFDPNPV